MTLHQKYLFCHTTTNSPIALEIRQYGETCFVVLEIRDALDKTFMRTMIGSGISTWRAMGV